MINSGLLHCNRRLAKAAFVTGEHRFADSRSMSFAWFEKSHNRFPVFIMIAAFIGMMEKSWISIERSVYATIEQLHQEAVVSASAPQV